MGDGMKQGALLMALLVLVHHIVAFVHGDAHSDLAITLSMFQNSIIYIVITALPVIGVVLLWTPYKIIGLYSILFGMVVGLVFGIYYHYLFVSPDHISHLPNGAGSLHATFVWTAGVLAIFEGICAAVASYLLGRHSRA